MTYDELRAAFEGILKRRDLTTTLRDMWLQEGLSRCQYLLRIPSMEKTYEADLTSAEITIPSDLLQVRSITVITTDGRELELRLKDLYTVLQNTSDMLGVPTIYARRGGTWVLAPAPSSGLMIRVDYYGEFEPLSVGTDQNVLSIIKPFVIVYGALSLAADYFLDKRAPAFEERFAQQISELNNQAAQDELINAAVAPAAVWSED